MKFRFCRSTAHILIQSGKYPDVIGTIWRDEVIYFRNTVKLVKRISILERRDVDSRQIPLFAISPYRAPRLAPAGVEYK